MNDPAKHIRLLAVLHLVVAGLQLLAGVVALLFLTLVFDWVRHEGIDAPNDDLPRFSRQLILALPMVLIALSLPGIAAGAGLLRRRGWARILAMVLGGLYLLNAPVGTALGIYTFWVLLDDDATRLLSGPDDAPARRSGDNARGGWDES
ncbi:MAG: hypothetical protein KDC87_00020 [Planctomycetes bacterium]|nr:hypothetical protein [Planctomycetota bacterium]MCB9870184.1 hypothetical protein [Planctomycetota bacterium]MCB9888236.1 hypothetical protein [Planctomycetota bacterium]